MPSVEAQSTYQSINEALKNVYENTDPAALETIQQEPEFNSKLDEARAIVKEWLDTDGESVVEQSRANPGFLERVASFAEKAWEKIKNFLSGSQGQEESTQLDRDLLSLMESDVAPVERRIFMGLIRRLSFGMFLYFWIALMEVIVVSIGGAGATLYSITGGMSVAGSVLGLLPTMGPVGSIIFLACSAAFCLLVSSSISDWFDRHGKEASQPTPSRGNNNNPFSGNR